MLYERIGCCTADKCLRCAVWLGVERARHGVHGRDLQCPAEAGGHGIAIEMGAKWSAKHPIERLISITASSPAIEESAVHQLMRNLMCRHHATAHIVPTFIVYLSAIGPVVISPA